MFGRLYHRREAAVAEGGLRAAAADKYARLLLAELLDRARVLEAVRDGAGRNDEASLRVAVAMFLVDAAEARTRGLRARLFCRTEDGGLDPWSVDPDDDLRDLGGELQAGHDGPDQR